MLKTTGSSDSTPKWGADRDEVVGGGGKANDRNLSKSKKSKMQSPEFRHVSVLSENLYS